MKLVSNGARKHQTLLARVMMNMMTCMPASALQTPESLGVPGGFPPNCVSSSDYGWPRFASRAALEADAKWSSYFMRVYGELPTSYPVCAYDLQRLDRDAWHSSGLAGARRVVETKDVTEGDLFVCTWGIGLQIYHSEWAPVPNHSWVEIFHRVVPTEVMGSWVWRQRGSGIWVNVGRTVVFPTPALSPDAPLHLKAMEALMANCSRFVDRTKYPQYESDIFGFCAREKGYDSVQFAPKDAHDATTLMGTYKLPGVTELELVNLDGDKTCGVADARATPLRAGWHASAPCECVNRPIAPECGIQTTCKLPPCAPQMCEVHGSPDDPPCRLGACEAYSPQSILYGVSNPGLC